MSAPKLFMSYSWSNPSHEQWVITLANELAESGVHVILDKWDLKEGHDAVAFMEKMVTDAEIEKVLIICDKGYASKADGRAGGVGTETQIISKEVYENQEQDKFVAVIAEKDEYGKAYLPTYYKSRIYIDLSEGDTYTENFESLLRWIYNKPLYKRPQLGKRPSFLDESDNISLGTTVAYKRAISSVKENKSFASGAIDEYLTIFSENLENFRIHEGDGELDDLIIENIDKFLPYRNEVITLLMAIAQYSPTEENLFRLHRFFESLIPYMERPADVRIWSPSDYDNFKFIVHELFLYLIAIWIKYERFSDVNTLLTQQFYIAGKSNYGDNNMVGYEQFRDYLESMEHRNQRLGLRRASLVADLLKQRSTHSGIEFRHLMQADFILYIRAEIRDENFMCPWFPDTLVYAGRSHGAFEVFARASSKSYFNRMKCILGIDKPDDISELLEVLLNDRQKLPRWNSYIINPAVLMGFEDLATRP